MAVADDGSIAVGQSNNTTFLRPVTAGTVHAEAAPRHRGRTTWVWDVDFTDDDGRLCAIAPRDDRRPRAALTRLSSERAGAARATARRCSRSRS